MCGPAGNINAVRRGQANLALFDRSGGSMNMRRQIKWFTVLVVLCASVTLSPLSAVHANDCLAGPNVPGCKFGLPADQYDALLGQMNANPAPNMTMIAVNMSEIHRFSFYKWRSSDVTFYNAPNGSPVGQIDPGFSYVYIIDISGDWAEVGEDMWVPMDALVQTYASAYGGALVNGAQPFPVAWVNTTIYTSAVPGQNPEMSKPPISKYVRVFIYATATVAGWEWYLIGPGRWVEQRHVGRLMATARPAGVSGRWVAVDLYEQVLIAYDGDQMVFTTLISSGLPPWWTNLGLFKVYARLPIAPMSGSMGQTDYYKLPRVPY